MGVCGEPEQPETWDDVKQLAPSLSRKILVPPEVKRLTDFSGTWIWQDGEFSDTIIIEESKHAEGLKGVLRCE